MSRAYFFPRMYVPCQKRIDHRFYLKYRHITTYTRLPLLVLQYMNSNTKMVEQAAVVMAGASGMLSLKTGPS